MIEKMIIVTEIEDEDRYTIVWHTLANQCPDLTTSHCCEIDTSTWDEDAWKDWQQRLAMIEDALDVDDDAIIIWHIGGGQFDRHVLGNRA